MKNRHLYIILLKTIVLILSLGYILHKIWNQKELGKLFNEIDEAYLFYFSVVTFLVFINWSLEAVKWQFILSKIQTISFIHSIKSIFTGITISIFTPNRVGEFGGRILFLKKENMGIGVVATLLGNLSQLLITLFAGFIFIPFFMKTQSASLPIKINPTIFFSVIAVVILAGLFVYFNVSNFTKVLCKIKKLEKVLLFFEFLNQYRTLDLLKILLFSSLRYLVFTFQYYLLLKVFGVNLNYLVAIASISQVYLIMTIIPTFALAELGVRGSVAVLIIGLLSNSTLGILSASIVLWFFNLALPSIIGSIFLYKLKI